MTSHHLSSYGFANWQEVPIDDISCRNLILRLPRRNGVYILKADASIPRLVDSSDLIYIGHGKIQTRLQNLLISFLPHKFKNYKTPHTAYKELTRIIQEMGLKIFVAYKEYEEKDHAKNMESVLIRKYCSDHIEPPPLNNTRR